ncbi:MAG: nicotinate-nucleotide diphosphorylase (carboxylating) [Gammaproteobacteria bacterium]|jgi:nicotinate-nucleotide pyrophosphorylase (carboxylating)|nr:nicotinate-nucleotide diphosphorylase (carboxylating) [Gammaproteobacteria bacterium]MCH2577035.1 carboxylating nicotinate-nucleotide diphosphorylase [Pseudomonadales bacterium]MEC7765492.1 carboxylating nicotinate-nucleotide diphosphorylase [Pseudomonadota bacterium]MBI90997.1 nicotinate-nucleotide diphosphorylase (carboxylating) [Gammaproteobacteria bacterium]MEC9300586.1 carboxylating nicotinate-nucleotide diphosphorylase [Pseudomonadota bacterium]|tara:strand:+ start:1369 stop:2211 length:843 start_codon:yes stop_codon:yes gene_type:complete
MNTLIPTDIEAVVRSALAEDIGSGDITAGLVPAKKKVTARIISREGGVLCGAPWVTEVFSQLDDSIVIHWQLEDSDSFEPEQIIAELTGPARAIMTGERTALNFLQLLSGTASYTRGVVARIIHTPTELLDTRKTLPGLRTAQKYAVRIGGGHNHRMGLFDAYLIKENHIATFGGISEIISTARTLMPGKSVEIEVQNLEQLREALAAGADTILLDNFDITDLQEAVAINQGRSKLEASGGIDQDLLVKIAETGVDYISIGALTKHCRAIDLSLLIQHVR